MGEPLNEGRIKWLPLRVGHVVDVRVTTSTSRSFVGRLNGRMPGGWRLGRSDGRRALLRVLPPYRQIVLWPRAKR